MVCLVAGLDSSHALSIGRLELHSLHEGGFLTSQETPVMVSRNGGLDEI